MAIDPTAQSPALDGFPETQSCAGRLAERAGLLENLACLMAWNSGNTLRRSGETVAISGAVEELARTIDSIATATTATREQSFKASSIVSHTVVQAGAAIQAIAASFSEIRSRTGLLGSVIRSLGEMAREIEATRAPFAPGPSRRIVQLARRPCPAAGGCL